MFETTWEWANDRIFIFRSTLPLTVIHYLDQRRTLKKHNCRVNLHSDTKNYNTSAAAAAAQDNTTNKLFNRKVSVSDSLLFIMSCPHFAQVTSQTTGLTALNTVCTFKCIHALDYFFFLHRCIWLCRVIILTIRHNNGNWRP